MGINAPEATIALCKFVRGVWVRKAEGGSPAMARKAYHGHEATSARSEAARLWCIRELEERNGVAKADNSGETCRFNILDNAHDEEYIHEL